MFVAECTLSYSWPHSLSTNAWCAASLSDCILCPAGSGTNVQEIDRERVRERESCAMKGTFSTPLTLVQVGCSQLLREEDCKQHVQFAVSLYLAIGSGLAALPGCLQIRRSPAELTLGCQDFFQIVSIFLLQDAPSA